MKLGMELVRTATSIAVDTARRAAGLVRRLDLLRPSLPKQFETITEQEILDAYNAACGANATSATINGPRHWVLDAYHQPLQP